MLEGFANTPTDEIDDNGISVKLSILQRLWKAVLSEKLTFVFGGFTLLCAWSLTSLLAFHAMIVSIAQTTNERVRGVYRFGQTENAADMGCAKNWFTAACYPVPVSRLPRDMSELVIADYENRPEYVWNGDDEGEDGGTKQPVAAQTKPTTRQAETDLESERTADRKSFGDDSAIGTTSGEGNGEIVDVPV